LATGSEDSSSRFWDVQTGKCVRLFKGHKGPIYSIAISPDGKILATGSMLYIYIYIYIQNNINLMKTILIKMLIHQL